MVARSDEMTASDLHYGCVAGATSVRPDLCVVSCAAGNTADCQ